MRRKRHDAPSLLPPLQPCKVYVYDTDRFNLFPEHLRQRYMHWDRDPFATELWLRRALMQLTHPWRASKLAGADLVFVAARFAQMCAAAKSHTGGQEIYEALLSDNEYANSTAAKATSLQYLQGCEPPWMRTPGGQPGNMVALLDQFELHWLTGQERRACFQGGDVGANHPPARSHGRDCPLLQLMVTPFAITQPEWLVGGAVPERTPWRKRKLLFFGGHMPKLFNNRLRYDVWVQMRNDPRATTQSRTINCSIGQFAICANDGWGHPRASLGATSDLHTYCHAACGATRSAIQTSATSERMEVKAPYSCVGDVAMRPRDAAGVLRRSCKAYEGVDFAAVGADVARDAARSGDRVQYLRAAAEHRFCLITQGDPGNTPKITESIALGGAGGCIPLFVLYAASGARPPMPTDFMRDYPYVRWLDYCNVGYFVSAHAVRTSMTRVLDWLERVPPQEANAKLRALRAVRPAFVFRPNASVADPAAGEFVINELCRRASTGGQGLAGDLSPHEPWVVGGAHERCTLHF